MLIGARIISNNLSGKTATVQFTPLTGTTSGTTVDMGSVTIPFDNITSHPYGNYSINVTDYDYVYTLTIPEPAVGDVQMFVAVDRMPGLDNYGAAILNFNDFTAEIIDLDIDASVWNNRDVYFSNESGFMYYFTLRSNSSERLVIFTDSSNTEIERYSGATSSFSRGILQEKWTYAEFVNLGVLKYSDGTNVYTYNWDNTTHNIDIESSWDEEASDGTFIINKFELGSWNYNGDGESYIVNPEDGTTTLFKTWTDGTNIRHKISPSSNFIVVETQNQDANYSYTNLEICDLTGTVLDTVSLTGNTYTSNYTEFHGTNKFTTIYWNNNDVEVDYKIIHYNGNTDTLIETSHVKGASYSSIDINGNVDFYPSTNNENRGGVVIMFYNYLGGNNIGAQVSYCDILYMFDNQSSFSTYTFANNETKSIQTWGQLSDMYRAAVDNGDGLLSFLTIMSGSTRIESMSVNVSDIFSFNSHYLNNKSLVQIFTDGANDVTYKYINAAGVVTDTVTDTLSSQYDSQMYSEGEVAYMSLNTSTNGNIAFYVYSGSSEIITTDYYFGRFTSGVFGSENKQIPDVIFLLDQGGVFGRILTSTGMSNQISLPEMDTYDVTIGKDKFMIIYGDPNDNSYKKINLYNFSGTLLNSQSTTYGSVSNWWAVKDRFVVNFYNEDDDTNVYYLVSDDTITSVELDSYDNTNTLNDYIWWND